MSQNIQSAMNVNLVDEIVSTKSDEVLKASLGKLQAILNVIGDGEETPEKGEASSSNTVMKSVLAKLQPMLNGYMKSNLSKARALMTSLAGTLEEYAEGGEEACAKVVEAITPAIKNYLAANPNEFMNVIHLIAPLIRKSSGSVAKQIALAKVAFLQYERGSVGVSSSEFTQVFASKIAPILTKGIDSATALEGMYKEIRPTLEKLYAENPSKMQSFLNELDPILGEIAIQDPSRLSAIVENKGLENAYNSGFGSIRNKLSMLGNADSLNLGQAMGTAMLFIQKFKASIANGQANQDKLTAAIGVAMINSAQALQQNITAQIKSVEAQVSAAQNRPWWQWLVIGLVAVLGAIVAGFTAGVTGAIIALAMGSFMASPAFGMVTQDIANAFKPMLISIYEAEGMSKKDATEKATAVANIIAKVIVTVAVVVVSCGAGVIGAALTEGVDAAVTTGVEEAVEGGAEEGAEEGGDSAGSTTEKAANSASKYSKAFKVAALEGLSTLTASNIWMDIMSVNPEWLKNNQTLATVLDTIIEIVGVLVTVYAGLKCFAGIGNAATALEKLPIACRAIFPLSFASQIGEGGMEAYFAANSAGYLNEAGNTMKMVGQLEGQLSGQLAVADSMTTTQGINDTSATAIARTMGQAMNDLEDASGKTWGSTLRVLSK